MDSMKRFIIVAMLHAAVVGYSQQEQRYYDIRFGGIKIGELKATRTVRDSVTRYELESDVSFWCLTKVRIQHHIESIYSNNRLISTRSVSNAGDDVYTSSAIWKDGYYHVKVDSYKYSNHEPIYEAVECNIARLYFVEPVGVGKTLADSEGTLSAINTLKPGSYEVGKGKNEFHYEHGELRRASIFSRIRYEVVIKK